MWTNPNPNPNPKPKPNPNSCGVSKERATSSIGRLASIMPLSSHLNRSNHRKLEGKPAQVRGRV